MMKKYISAIVTLLFVSIVALAQPSAAPQIKKKEVMVVNWGGRSVSLLPTFWTPGINEELLRQLTPEQIAEVKANCSEAAWPVGFASAKNGNEENADAKQAKLSKLKLYQIASFNNIRGGKNYGEMAIVLVSATENKEWDPELVWEKNLYFLFYTNDLKLKN